MATSRAVTCCVPTTPIDRPVEPLASALASITVTATPRSTKWSALDKPSAPPPMTTICNASTPSTAPCETDHFFSRHRNQSDGTIQHTTTDVLQWTTSGQARNHQLDRRIYDRVGSTSAVRPIAREWLCRMENGSRRLVTPRSALRPLWWFRKPWKYTETGRSLPCAPRLPMGPAPREIAHLSAASATRSALALPPLC